MEASMLIMFNMHVHACVRVCACMCMHLWIGHPPHTHTHPHPHPPIHHPPEGTPYNQLKFDNTWTNQDISIPFKDLKSVKNSPPMGGCMVRWVGGWMGGLMGGLRLNHWKFKNCWLNQDNSILFDDLWFLETPRPTHPPMGGCEGGWVGQWVHGWGQVKWLTIE